MFKEHKIFDTPPDNQVIWRYMSFTRFVSLLQKQALWFAVPSKLGDDPWEGVYPEKNRNKEQLTDLMKTSIPETESGALKNVVDGLYAIANNKALRDIFAASCWCMSEIESYVLWKCYANLKSGIAIKSSIGSLKKSFDQCTEDVFIGRIKYIDYKEAIVNFGNLFEIIVNKRKNFEQEMEVRAAVQFNENHEKIKRGEPIEAGKYIPINPEMLIDEIYLPSSADPSFEELVKSVLEKYNLHKRIIVSSLFSDPY